MVTSLSLCSKHDEMNEINFIFSFVANNFHLQRNILNCVKTCLKMLPSGVALP